MEFGKVTINGAHCGILAVQRVMSAEIQYHFKIHISIVAYHITIA